jgi:hypothetical protein
MQVERNPFRRQRMRLFLSLLPGNREHPVRILDIGGTVDYWRANQDLWGHIPLNITIVNLGVEPRDEDVFSIRPGDACNLVEFADNSFDVVHSNSVIEHVGHWAEMAAMAREVRRLAPVYYLQTPNFWFPVEPHYRAFGYHWLPESIRAAILTRMRLGFRGPRDSFDLAMRDIQTVNLLTSRQMRALFPDADIRAEWLLGLPKSLIALRRA